MHKTTRACCNSYIIFCITIIIAVINPLYASDTSSTDSKTEGIIDKIIIDGIKRTKERTILLYMDIDSGDIYDTAMITQAEKRLNESKLFDHVKIFSIPKENNVTLLVVVREKQYFTISNYGGVIHDKRYGEPTDRIWLQGYGTVTLNNFGGRNEKLNISASLIRIRYIGLSWYKPIITTPYYIQIGSKLGTYPSIVNPLHIEFFNTSYIIIGRNFGKYLKLYSSLTGKYKKSRWEGIWYSIVTDTINNTSDTIHYDDIIETYEKPYSELFLSLGGKFDKRNKIFNPHSGFYFSINALTNVLYPWLRDYEYCYLQISNDLGFYHRGIWESNTVAYRIRPLIRFFGKGNIHTGVFMGSETSLRGYGRGGFGGSQYNNRLLFSWEYRFPIVTLPEMSFPWLSWYDKSLNSFRSRIDGVLILDCGYIWKNVFNLQHPKEDHRSAAGAGFGFRFMFPSLRRSVCAEMVFPFAFPEGYFEKYGPTMYLYLDMPF